MKIDRSRRSLRILAVLGVAAVALAACSSQGGAPAPGWWQCAAAGGDGRSYTIAMITHEQAGDTFWDKIRAGAQDAADEHGINLKYSNNENGPEQATLVQNAIDSKVSGIAVTLSSADAVVPVAKKAADAGIPVVAFNQGIDQYKDAGAKMYFGSDELLAGQTIGQKLTQQKAAARRCASSRPRARSPWRPAARVSRRATRTPRTSRSTALTCRRCSRPSSRS